MSAAVIFGPLEAAVMDYLAPALGVPVHGSTPASRPDTWLRVFRSGGARTDIITEDAQITVESWSSSSVTAEDNAQRARALLQAARGETLSGIRVYRVAELGGPADLPDPASFQPRWTFTVVMRVRGLPFP